MRTAVFIIISSFISSFGYCQKQVTPDTTWMLKTIRFFSSPENQGRLPGHQGYNICSKFSADYFEELKLLPFAGNTWYQNFNIEMNEIRNNSCSFEIDGNKKTLIPGNEYSLRGFSGSGRCSSEIVFCGYGLDQPDDGYSDYSGVEVRGKVAMIFKQNPAWQIKGIKWSGSSIRYKVGIARAQGAKAVIFVNTPSSKRTRPIASQLEGDEKHIGDIPALEFSTEVADVILKEKGTSIADMQAKIDTLQVPLSFATGVTTDISADCKYTPDALTQNIIACYPGNDPVLKNEFVIISAHLDHVGFQGEVYYPGANDNASGSSVVLDVARMWRKSKIKPARTVVFVLFSCEEHGLDGAKYLASHFPGDTSKIVAILNADCIGHGDSLMIGGGESSPDLWKLAAGFAQNKPLSARTWYGGGADSQPFFEIGVPSLYFATVNSYTYLHMTGDKVETLNPEMLKLTADIVFNTSVKISSKEYTKEKFAER